MIRDASFNFFFYRSLSSQLSLTIPALCTISNEFIDFISCIPANENVSCSYMYMAEIIHTCAGVIAVVVVRVDFASHDFELCARHVIICGVQLRARETSS